MDNETKTVFPKRLLYVAAFNFAVFTALNFLITTDETLMLVILIIYGLMSVQEVYEIVRISKKTELPRTLYTSIILGLFAAGVAQYLLMR